MLDLDARLLRGVLDACWPGVRTRLDCDYPRGRCAVYRLDLDHAKNADIQAHSIVIGVLWLTKSEGSLQPALPGQYYMAETVCKPTDEAAGFTHLRRSFALFISAGYIYTPQPLLGGTVISRGNKQRPPCV